MDVKIKATGPGLKLNGNFQTSKSIHNYKEPSVSGIWIHLFAGIQENMCQPFNSESSLNLL